MVRVLFTVYVHIITILFQQPQISIPIIVFKTHSRIGKGAVNLNDIQLKGLYSIVPRKEVKLNSLWVFIFSTHQCYTALLLALYYYSFRLDIKAWYGLLYCYYCIGRYVYLRCPGCPWFLTKKRYQLYM